MSRRRDDPQRQPSLLEPRALAIPREYRLTIVIDGLSLTLDARHVPDPPIQHFSKNVNTLFEHWKESTILSVDGHGIPLKYWPDVYKGLGRLGFKRKAWEAIKVEWGNWKVSTTP